MAKKIALQNSGEIEPLATAPAAPTPPPVSRLTSIAFRDVWLGALLLGATVLAYWPALGGGFVWDDDSHVPRLDLQSFHGLWRIWFDLGATQQYYPLLFSAFWTEHRLWGDAALGYHLANVALHVVSAYLVVAIMRRLALPGAWLAAFIFALHPVCVESVAWISEQKNTLSTVFYLGSALAYLHFDQTRRRSRYFQALGLFLLALLSKTVTATLPAALLVILWWKRGRLDWKRDVRPLLSWLVLGAAAGLFSAWVERTYIGARGADFALTWFERFLLAGRIIWFYFGKLLWPANLIFHYPHWKVDPAVWWQYLFPLGIVALAGGLLPLARRRRGPLAAFLLFTGTLFPVMGFFNVYPFVFSYVADHFQYLASLGLIVPSAAGLTLTAGHLRVHARRLAPVLFSCLLLAAGVLTFCQTKIYRNAETLYRETLARNPDAWMAHNNLGVILAERPGHLAEAMAEFQAALRIKPDAADAHYNLGNALAKIPGRWPEAAAEFEAALRIRPDDAEMHYNLGNALVNISDQWPEAAAEFEEALRIKPDFADAHASLGFALVNVPGRLPEAITEFKTALRINPDLAEVHDGLGCALGNAPERLPEAIGHFQTAVRIKPDYAEAHTHLGTALSMIPGRQPEAMAEFEAALRINPNDAEAHNNLGCALGNMPGKLSEAIGHFQAAGRIKPDYAEAHKNLGLALSVIPGRQTEAIAELEAALRINPDLESARQGLEQLRALDKLDSE